MKKLNKKGFTLVEVLAVVVILGLLVTLIVVNYDKIFNDASSDISSIERKNVESAAYLYVMENYNFDDAPVKIKLTWKNLYENGIIKIDEYEESKYVNEIICFSKNETKMDWEIVDSGGCNTVEVNPEPDPEPEPDPIPDPEPVLLSNHIKDLAGTTQGSGMLVHETFTNDSSELIDTGYRYEGSNPNNYIEFNCDEDGSNCETWRIIGVFDTVLADGETTQPLVKLIKDETLMDLSWSLGGDFGESNWSTSGAKDILNNYYYNETDGTNSGNCSVSSSGNKGDCNFTSNGTKKGITESGRNKIENVTWNLGGSNTTEITAHQFYEAERGNAVYPGRPTTDTGKIGLMYPSDYGYASSSSTCLRDTNLYDYDSNNCKNNSWIFYDEVQWTITPRSSSSYRVFYVSGDGYVNDSGAAGGYGLRPVLYLNSSATLLSGEGTESKPYKLG